MESRGGFKLLDIISDIFDTLIHPEMKMIDYRILSCYMEAIKSAVNFAETHDEYEHIIRKIAWIYSMIVETAKSDEVIANTYRDFESYIEYVKEQDEPLRKQIVQILLSLCSDPTLQEIIKRKFQENL